MSGLCERKHKAFVLNLCQTMRDRNQDWSQYHSNGTKGTSNFLFAFLSVQYTQARTLMLTSNRGPLVFSQSTALLLRLNSNFQAGPLVKGQGHWTVSEFVRCILMTISGVIFHAREDGAYVESMLHYVQRY